MKFNSLFILLSFIVLSIQIKAQENTGKYFQEIRTDISLPYEAGNNVIKLFSVNKIPIAITSNGVYKFSNGKWRSNSFTSKISCATIDSKDVVWLATANAIQNEEGSTKYSLPELSKNDTVLCLFWENENTLHVGTSNGLFLFNGNWMEVPAAKGKRINSIVLDEKQNLWLATNDGLIKRTGEEWINLDDVLMANGLKRVYYSLCKAQNEKDLLFGGLLTVGCIAENGRHWMWSGADGLPYGPINSIVLHKL